VSAGAPPRTWSALDLDPAAADAELVGRIAAEIGSPGAELRSGAAGPRWRLYLPQGDPGAWSLRVRELWRAWSPAPAAPVLELVEEPERDWSGETRSGFRGADAEPFWIGPPWLEPPAGRTTVRILPGRAFGTGLHATTRLALRLLGRLPVRGARVLDVGTGSGVLALAALAHGAREAVGVDLDAHALANAAENAALNGAASDAWSGAAHGRVGAAPPLRLVAGSLDALAPPAVFDLVLANLERGTLLPLIRRLRETLAAGGTLVASGLLAAQAPELLRAAAAAGLVAVDRRKEEGWWGAALRTA
jgi:ribosomal protein L11 methyltransferase